MRISTSVFMSTSLAGIQEQQARIARLSAQLAADKRILQPKDDPVAAGRALSLTHSIAQSRQYLANQDHAVSLLKEETTVLSAISTYLGQTTNTLQGIQSSQDALLHRDYASQLRALREQLLALGNHQDSDGNYIFAGYASTTRPFAPVAYGGGPPARLEQVSYAGDANQREIAVAQGRKVVVSDPGGNVAPALYDPASPTQPVPVFASLDMNGNTYDGMNLLDMLDTLATALENPATLTQTMIADAHAFMSEASEVVERVEVRVGTTLAGLASLREVTQSLLNAERSELDRLTELDQAAAIVELQQRQTALQAAEQAFATTSSLSLFNFL